jgi:hypothetical protein
VQAWSSLQDKQDVSELGLMGLIQNLAVSVAANRVGHKTALSAHCLEGAEAGCAAVLDNTAQRNNDQKKLRKRQKPDLLLLPINPPTSSPKEMT